MGDLFSVSLVVLGVVLNFIADRFGRWIDTSPKKSKSPKMPTTEEKLSIRREFYFCLILFFVVYYLGGYLYEKIDSVWAGALWGISGWLLGKSTGAFNSVYQLLEDFTEDSESKESDEE